MNRKDALKKLKNKSKYIDPEVFQNIEEKIKRDIKEDIAKENDEFLKKAIYIVNTGISIKVLKNLILSELYNTRVTQRLPDFNS